MRELTREELERENEILRIERNYFHAKRDHLVKILTAIHSAMYPPPVDANGKTYVFRPEDPHLFMQALSDRIRAIPDELANLSD